MRTKVRINSTQHKSHPILERAKKAAQAFSLETLEGKFEFFAKDRAEKTLWLARFTETEIRKDSLRSKYR